MLASARRAVSRPGLGEHAVGRERALGGEEGVDVDRAVAEQVVLGHRLDDVARRRRAWIHLSARTIALASACAVVGFLSRKVCGVYRQPAGIGPPNTLSASATMRVSETIFRSPLRVSSVITGSRLEIASIWPGAHRRDRAAAGADADDRDVARLQAGLGEHEVGHHVGRRARRGDADLLALQIGHRLEVRHRLRVDAEHDLRRPALQHEGAQPLALDLHVDGVLERARDDVGAAADHRLQRARAAGEIDDRDVEALRP